MASEAPFEREQRLKNGRINDTYKIIGGQTYKIPEGSRASRRDENKMPHEAVDLNVPCCLIITHNLLSLFYSRRLEINLYLKLKRGASTWKRWEVV